MDYEEDYDYDDDDEKDTCQACGDPKPEMLYDGMCPVCRFGGEKCEGCFVVKCNNCGEFPRHKPGCEARENEDSEDEEGRCSCDPSEDEENDEEKEENDDDGDEEE